jgi:hypothetical protein
MSALDLAAIGNCSYGSCNAIVTSLGRSVLEPRLAALAFGAAAIKFRISRP